MPQDRRLAAIMFTDIVGYTALMGTDEEKAFQVLKKNREVQRPIIKKYQGEWLKEMGDGILASFNTASDAVRCAGEIQNKALKDDISLRIGIHIGEVVFENGDVFGDGVNVAFHLEEQADAGAINVSGVVYKEVRNKTGISGELLEDKKLKNVDDPIKIYRVSVEKLPEQASDSTESERSVKSKLSFSDTLKHRNVIRPTLVYVLAALLVWKMSDLAVELLSLNPKIVNFITLLLIVFFPIAIFLAWRYERSPEGFIRTDSKASHENPYRDEEKKRLTSNASIILLTLTTLLLFLVKPLGLTSGNAIDMDASEASLGIIPFRNYTGDEQLDHFGIGIASEVSNDLSLINQFDFISSLQATIKYQNSDHGPLEIGESLGVTHIVTGMYQHLEDNMRVSVEMVEAASGKILWGFSYETKYQDLFSLQSDISDRIMQKFSLEKVDRGVPTQNLEAFAQYTRGQTIIHSSLISYDMIKAIPYFEKAIQLDSGYLDPWLGIITVMSYYIFNSTPPIDTLYTEEEVKPYYEYVLNNFPDSWKKDEIKGMWAYWIEGDYTEGLEYFEKALEENPTASIASPLIGAIYRRTMQHEKALQNRVKMVKRRPNSYMDWNELGAVFRDNGDFENFELVLKKLYEMNNQYIGNLYWLKLFTNSLEELPDPVKNKRGKLYQADLIRQKRDFTGLKNYLDTVKLDTTFNILNLYAYKAYNFYNLKMDDSATHYANKFLITSENMNLNKPGSGTFGFTKFMYSILDQKEKAFESYLRGTDDEDLIKSWFRGRFELKYYTFARDYEEATTKLENLNKQYPEMGYYCWLNTPNFDRIKEEYPPFQDAVNNLKMPPKLTETNPLDM